jgi:phosphopantetheine adenylyltransferase
MFEIIRLVTTRPMSTYRIMGFECPVRTTQMGPAGMTMSTGVNVVRQTLWFFPDPSAVNGEGLGLCHAFMIDTPLNRTLLKSAIHKNYYRPMNQKIHQELLDEAMEAGIRTTPIKRVNKFIKQNAREERLEGQLDKKDTRIRQLEIQLEKQKADREALEKEAEKVAAKKAAEQEQSVEVTVVDPDTEELTTKKIEAEVVPEKKKPGRPPKK